MICSSIKANNCIFLSLLKIGVIHRDITLIKWFLLNMKSGELKLIVMQEVPGPQILMNFGNVYQQLSATI